MRLGVLSDVHSNIEALEGILAELKGRGAQGWVVLGDHVGYGPNPNEVVAMLAGLKPLWAVSGNHDLAALDRMDLAWFNPIAAEAILWTRQNLEDASRKWLESLPPLVEEKGFTGVHGSPKDPATEYILTSRQFLDNLERVKAFPCFIGHSHIPLYFQLLGDQNVLAEVAEGNASFRRSELPCMINPGSVGQPRDMDPRASAGVYDEEEGTFEWVRVPYAVEKVQRKIRSARLPEFLAERLTQGR